MLGGGCLILGISFGKVVDFLGLSLYEILKFFKQVGLWLTNLFKKSGPWLKRRRNSLHDKVQQDYFEDTKHGQDNSINEKVKDEGLTATELSADELTETVTIENDINDDKNLPPAHSTDDPALWNEQSSQNSQKNVREIQPKPTNPDYELPDASLLQDVAPTDQSQEKKALRRNQDVLKKTFKSFGVDVELKNTILGPSVTKYELHPAIGVKVSKIVNLSDDLALALAAKDIRIEAPIPGKPLIGIEVPNQQVATISFKD
ncbi:DNA translocase FtsK, partial [Ligilactobacillus acidipiscis]